MLFGSGLTVSEDAVSSPYSFVNVNCSASSGVTPSISGQQVTFTIDADTDVFDCTFNNKKELGSIKVVKRSIKTSGSRPWASRLPGNSFSVEGQSNLTTGDDGTACVSNLAFGDYDVAEITAPDGYSIDNAAVTTVTISANSDCTNTPAGNTVTRDGHPADGHRRVGGLPGRRGGRNAHHHRLLQR